MRLNQCLLYVLYTVCIGKKKEKNYHNVNEVGLVVSQWSTTSIGTFITTLASSKIIVITCQIQQSRDFLTDLCFNTGHHYHILFTWIPT